MNGTVWEAILCDFQLGRCCLVCLQSVRRGDNFRPESARHASGVRRGRVQQDPAPRHEDGEAPT